MGHSDKTEIVQLTCSDSYNVCQ